jgi:putative tricarboxylic transport membrane protein
VYRLDLGDCDARANRIPADDDNLLPVSSAHAWPGEVVHDRPNQLIGIHRSVLYICFLAFDTTAYRSLGQDFWIHRRSYLLDCEGPTLLDWGVMRMLIMETLNSLMYGFGICLQPYNLFFAVLGCLFGTIIGVLPGVGPLAGTAMLLPLTFGMPPVSSIIMLSAIYYGAMYGGTITSVLVNVPGEAASAITCLDGYAMAKKGRAGAALAIAAIGSFIGGNIATMGLVLLAAPLTTIALKFGPPEFFSLMLIGLALATTLSSQSLLRALISSVLGLLLAMVGFDPVMGVPRFAFGQKDLLDGIGIVPIAMGLFGIGELLSSADPKASSFIKTRLREIWPSREEFKASVGPILRGSGIGFFLGLIPGVGVLVPTFISYAVEKKVSKHPERFGTGMIEGVAAPETANNAYCNAAMIPLFTLGVPSSAVIAILMGAFMMNGLIPGPFLFKEHPDVAWGVIASLYVGNLTLLIMNLPMIPIWVSFLKIPTPILYTLILGFCTIGAYSGHNSVFDVGITLVFGVIGYAFKKLDIPMAPLILTVILGPLMERALRNSLEISRGDFTIFFTNPISATLLGLTALFVVMSLMKLATQVKQDRLE